MTDHEFLPVLGHPDDDECTYRKDGTDATYCGLPATAHSGGSKESDLEDHFTKMIDAALTAAWMQKCGPAGIPGRWFIPGELLEVLDLSDFEIEVYPIRCHLKDGKPSSWSGHIRPGPDVVDAWDWRISVGWEDLKDDEGERLEELDGCVDDRSTSFLVLGSHDERPPIADGLAAAVAMLMTAYA